MALYSPAKLLMIATLASFLYSSETFAQDAQRAATARNARDRAAAGATANAKAPTSEPDGRDDAATDPQPEPLKRRAGEQIGDDAHGGSLVLGMTVQEARNGRVKVVDVGAATPAFDAGIRQGDEVVSFQKFKANDYRKW